MQPIETLSVFEAVQKTALMNGLCLVTESTEDITSVAAPETKELQQAKLILEVSDRMYCSVCSKTFENRDEQKEHYRLDWHRFNLKQRLLGHQMLTAEEFEAKTQADDVSSISGSDSSDCESNSESESQSCLNGERKGIGYCNPRSQRVLFKNSEAQLISVFRCVLLNTTKGSLEEPANLVASLQRQNPQTSWVILMAGGGHFAGAVFQGNEILAHKTFHRYTVRARRGTAQGMRDAQGTMPKSAGASLRRYNETALLKEIQELLMSWTNYLKEAECIFLRAPHNNQALFFSSKHGPLLRGDPRIRRIPFSTRRATFREVERVHGTLSSLLVYGNNTTVADLTSSQKTWKKAARKDEASTQPSGTSEEGSHFEAEGIHRYSYSVTLPVSVAKIEEEEDEEVGKENLELVEETLNLLDLREFEVTPKQNRKKRRRKPKTPPKSGMETSGSVAPSTSVCRGPESTEVQEQQESQDAPSTTVQDALFTACKMGDIGALQHLLGMADNTTDNSECSDKVTKQLLNTPLDESGWTVLHVAAAAGRTAVVRLLLESGADPAIRDRKEQPPYCVSTNKQTRNEFRRFMGEQPDRYDYTRAQVPGPLTAEMEARQAERRRAQKALRKQREREDREAQLLLEQEQEEKRRFALLSDREKRALMAERRFASQLKDAGASLTNTRRCWFCGESLLGCIPFHYLDFSFCSTNCLQAHRRGETAPS
ncbi:ankyrin repeat and zinc finger domain-containing protein 1 [Thamnophis elegans]|uniref:ankyrin repeat and zinc finger domain-containing protein 1 n=1 Tax=Thamnophis elegans TaxID=35005 RepID=UPI0013775926|nr:ankyrin repeat and zinc finger domain-containing protein 1 [Thamnophis elegans]XP_032073628.1 ankyrin repeat and zinc finger domain-containing protein 1 [Thamnophis elegans]XP_032073639.1 ankyrin repeat and zinc finger domain-containing protein 1 [Thamnophis elegans]XP_032073650.1 ankyrin repeat and zinc finger domain-containing protein 1 [Thamnophis elegans]XP_032073659.1 ankyrin repeat and zinc finger domain-containing protein 1 [Thamnophis elegans]